MSKFMVHQHYTMPCYDSGSTDINGNPCLNGSKFFLPLDKILDVIVESAGYVSISYILGEEYRFVNVIMVYPASDIPDGFCFLKTIDYLGTNYGIFTRIEKTETEEKIDRRGERFDHLLNKIKMMRMKDDILNSLNNQIKIEYDASNYYLSLAVYFEMAGFKGISDFFYNQSTEERDHMLMVIKYITEKGGKVIMPNLKQFEIPEELSVIQAFKDSLGNEMEVTNSVNESYHVAMSKKDYTTSSFLQWFIDEQRAEEEKFRDIIDKLKIIGDDGVGLYQIDNELGGSSEDGEPQ